MIFSNTTPFISLCAIGRLDLMPALFGRVHVVDAVVRECAAGQAIPVPELTKLNWITIAPSSTGTDPEPMLLNSTKARNGLCTLRAPPTRNDC